jgi:hypothetical protein
MSDKTQLASGFTVADYRQAVASKDGTAIASAIGRRFRERYLTPVTSGTKHGFAMMAAACLMIEALESFRQGWSRTDKNGRSPETFRLFFESSDAFKPFRGLDFYKHVRCGILHQAETTGGWKIVRKGPIFEPSTLTINATTFVRALSIELDGFCVDLEATAWDDPKWDKVRNKLKAIVEHWQIKP